MYFYRWGVAILFLTTCWFGMLLFHELGHIFAAWLSGASVVQVVFFPLSWTHVCNVEYPLIVYGTGAVFGTVFPVFLWLAAWRIKLSTAYLFRFFAGFCLIANGAYIGCDFSVTGPSDAGLLIEHGANRLILVLFGVLCVSAGLFLWHGLSLSFFPKYNGRCNRQNSTE